MKTYSSTLALCLVGAAFLGCSGEDGAAGAKGAQGDPGAQGNPGAKGDPGDPGDPGAQGDPGAKGDPGDPGATGDAGQDWPGPAPAAYTAADGIKGGAAFSEWFGTNGAGKGTLAQYSLTVGSEFVRCKSCHGWDGLGNAGSYANRTGLSTGTATRPDVSDVNLRVTVATNTYQELYDLIEASWGRPMNVGSDNRHPDFSTFLDAGQIWNIVKFMREEWVEPNALYDLQVSGPPMHYEMVAGVWTLMKPTLTFSNIGKDGDAVAGKTLYGTKCQNCHGATGATVTLESGTMTLGQFVRAKPHEAWFKIKFGQGTAMAPGDVKATSDLKNLYKALANTTDFPDK